MCVKGTIRRFKSGESIVGYNYLKIWYIIYTNVYYVCNAYKLIQISIF